MSETNKSKPFELLGKELKRLRIKRKESLMEVSGAVEIESEQLSEFENGDSRPSQEILALLISYFGIQEEASNKIWELAGYSNTNDSFVGNDDQVFQSPQVMVMPMDVRVVYTDLVHVMVNNYGVVINFMQGAGPNNQPLAVSRVGMSKEHARSLLDVLKTTLEQSEKPKEIKQLPLTTKKNPKQKENKEKDS